jgi:hypothetical protein
VKADKKGSPKRDFKNILNKIEARDRNFFKTFTNNPLIQPAHQKEYDLFTNEYISNYKSTYNLKFVNRATKSKIKCLINKILFIVFIRSSLTSEAPYYQIAAWLDYGFNWFIDPKREKIKFEEISFNCKKLIRDNLPDLPISPSDISWAARASLPSSLPVNKRKFIRGTIDSLRRYYKFETLPDDYISLKEVLPDDPSNLNDSCKDLFPITQRSDLTHLKDLRIKLAEFYSIPSKLPEKYFDLPQQQALPDNYHDLPHELAILFPVINDPLEIGNVSKTLRNHNFLFRFLPNDYIATKRHLPSPNWVSIKHDINLPASSQTEANHLINLLKTHYHFSLPLGPSWIDSSLYQAIKPPLPSLEEVKNTLSISSLDNKNPDFRKTINKIKNNYDCDTIPDNWIQHSLPDLTTIEAANKILSNNLSSIILPLTENEFLSSKITELRKYFFFNKLPPEFVLTTEQPEPKAALIPQI